MKKDLDPQLSNRQETITPVKRTVENPTTREKSPIAQPKSVNIQPKPVEAVREPVKPIIAPKNTSIKIPVKTESLIDDFDDHTTQPQSIPIQQSQPVDYLFSFDNSSPIKPSVGSVKIPTVATAKNNVANDIDESTTINSRKELIARRESTINDKVKGALEFKQEVSDIQIYFKVNLS